MLVEREGKREGQRKRKKIVLNEQRLPLKAQI